MSDPFIGEIRMFGGNFPPAGWAFCDGQLLPISENDALFTLIGTTYGGDGQETFALPNLQARVPIHMGQGPGLSPYTIAEQAGVEAVTITTQQMPTHTHPVLASEGAATSTTPTGGLPAESSKRIYRAPVTPAAMDVDAIGPAGGSQPHDNMQPYLAVNFIISLFGIFPQQN